MAETVNLTQETRQLAERILSVFEHAGASRIEADILQPSARLLDLYGEDIRARAFTTTDPLRGDYMLRPDFTVPVVEMHMSGGAEPARYTYMGKVFRAQEEDASRPSETLQVGYEVFDRSAPIEADAEVFALIRSALAPLELRVATGDMGLLLAAIRGLDTTDDRKAALGRHIWRPGRFRALLDRFSGRVQPPQSRLNLLEGDTDAIIRSAGPEIGLRSAGEVAERIERLRADAKAAPIDDASVALLDRLLSLKGDCDWVLGQLEGLADKSPSVADAVAAFRARCDALGRAGVDTSQLKFEGSYGRTSMEYYDGFVFGFYSDQNPGLPPVATGGRYDALTRVLGNGASIPAVGGVIRPELVQVVGGMI